MASLLLRVFFCLAVFVWFIFFFFTFCSLSSCMNSDSEDEVEAAEADKDDLARCISELTTTLRHLRKDPSLYLEFGLELEISLLELQREAQCHVLYKPYDFHSLDHIFLCRFNAHEITRMASVLLPETVSHPNRRRRVSCDGRQALCVVLARLASPDRWKSLRVNFGGKSVTWLSGIYHSTLDLLYEHAKKELWTFSSNLVEEIPGFVAACQDRFGFNAWGFMDGNHADVSRPSAEQRAFYSGYEGHHLLRALAIVRCDGMFECAFGPFPGSGSDLSMFNDTKMEDKLRNLHQLVSATHFLLPSEQVCILADSIFTCSVDIVTPYDYGDLKKNLAPGALPGALSERMRRKFFNLVHSGTRIAVEWGFGRCLNNWRALSYKAAMKVHHTSPEKAMLVSMFLTNFIVAARGAQHEDYFGVNAMSFEEYLMKIANL